MPASHEEFQREMARILLSNSIGRDIRNPILDGAFGTRDIDKECGYPQTIDSYDYIKMYERSDIAARVVDLEADECWKEYPAIFETEEERETDFEKEVDRLIRKTNLYSYMYRADRISGIGRYGVIFLGLDDGEQPDQPAPGFSKHGPSETPGDAEILYFRVLDEVTASITEFETDASNPRFNKPLYYNLHFAEDTGTEYSTTGEANARVVRTHWSRVIHLADNLGTSEIYGQPRMQNVYNRLLDLRKIYGGSGEMFWKGGFPGYSFEVDPKHGEFTADEKTALQAEAKLMSEGLQRYMTSVGVSVKSLLVQLASPRDNIDACMRAICTTKRVPYRIFVGSESGEKSGTNESQTWAERVAFRRNMYVTPHIIRETLDRFIQLGALPKPSDNEDGEYTVKWVPLAKLTEIERAQVCKDLTEALARYSTAGAEALLPFQEWLGKFAGLSQQQVESIMTAEKTSLSVVLQELAMGLAAGGTGSSGGNVPTSIPNMAKTKDPGKTPQNVQQRKKGTQVKVRDTQLARNALQKLRNETALQDETTHRRLEEMANYQREQVENANKALQETLTRLSDARRDEVPNPVNVTIHMPQGPAPEVTVNNQIDGPIVNVPQQETPEITVNVPQGPAPEVTVNNTVTSPEVTVNVPQALAPEVTVNVNPEIVLPKPNKEITVTRDSDGKITGLQTKAE
jgi:hypothetical protein